VFNKENVFKLEFMRTVHWTVWKWQSVFSQGHPVCVKHDAQMHRGQIRGEANKRKLSQKK